MGDYYTCQKHEFTTYQNYILEILTEIFCPLKWCHPCAYHTLQRFGVNIRIVVWNTSSCSITQSEMLILADKAMDLGLVVTFVRHKPRGLSERSTPVSIDKQNEANGICVWIPDEERSLNIS